MTWSILGFTFTCLFFFRCADPSFSMWGCAGRYLVYITCASKLHIPQDQEQESPMCPLMGRKPHFIPALHGGLTTRQQGCVLRALARRLFHIPYFCVLGWVYEEQPGNWCLALVGSGYRWPVRGPCLPWGPQWHNQPPLPLFSLQAVKWVRRKRGKADRQISGSTSVGLALMALCLHMEMGKHLQREPGPHCHLRWFLTLNPNGISSENLENCRQVGVVGFFFFLPTSSFYQQPEVELPKSWEWACFLWFYLANSESLKRSDNHPYLCLFTSLASPWGGSQCPTWDGSAHRTVPAGCHLRAR